MSKISAGTHEEFRDAVRRRFSITDEIEKLDRVKKSGSITVDEFSRLRAKLMQ